MLVLLTWVGCVVQNRESPDFRSPEVGSYARNKTWLTDSESAIETNKKFGHQFC